MMSNCDPNSQLYQYYFLYYQQPTNAILNSQPPLLAQPQLQCYSTTNTPTHIEGACCHSPTCKYRSKCPICNPSQIKISSTTQVGSNSKAKSIAKSLLKFSKQVLDPKPLVATQNCQKCPDTKQTSRPQRIKEPDESCLSCQDSTSSLNSTRSQKQLLEPSAPPCLSCQDIPSPSQSAFAEPKKKEYKYDNNDYKIDNEYLSKDKKKIIKKEYLYEDANGNLIPINPVQPASHSTHKKKEYIYESDLSKWNSNESLNSSSVDYHQNNVLYPDLKQYQKRASRVAEYTVETGYERNFTRSQSSSSLRSQSSLENQNLAHSHSQSDISTSVNSTRKLPYRNDSQASLKSILKNKDDKARSLEDILAQTSLRSRRGSNSSEKDTNNNNNTSNNRYITQMYIPSNSAANREIVIEARIPSSSSSSKKNKLNYEDDDGVPPSPLTLPTYSTKQTGKREYRPPTNKTSHPLEPTLNKTLRFGKDTTIEFD